MSFTRELHSVWNGPAKGSWQKSATFLFLLLMISHLLWAQVVTPEVKEASEPFICQCGCNHQLSACGMVGCGSATPLRAEIAGYLAEGKSRQEIVNLFVAKYGKVILSAPTGQGFDLAAWTMPFIALSFGLAVVCFVIKAWLRRKPAVSAGVDVKMGVPDEYLKRIEKELKELE